MNNILVIGAGGTGSILLPSLARFLYSINFEGNLTIVDGDHYEHKNLDRQIFAMSQLGMNKAKYQASVLKTHIPQLKDQIFYLEQYFSAMDIYEEVYEDTLVINCVDNKACRTFVERRVASLDNAAHICCGNTMRSGQVQLSLRRDGEWATPTIFEESPDLEDTTDDISDMNCQELSMVDGGSQIIATNMMAASIALCYVSQLLGGYPINNPNGELFIPAAYTYFDVLALVFENKSKMEITL